MFLGAGCLSGQTSPDNCPLTSHQGRYSVTHHRALCMVTYLCVFSWHNWLLCNSSLQGYIKCRWRRWTFTLQWALHYAMKRWGRWLESFTLNYINGNTDYMWLIPVCALQVHVWFISDNHRNLGIYRSEKNRCLVPKFKYNDNTLRLYI